MTRYHSRYPRLSASLSGVIPSGPLLSFVQVDFNSKKIFWSIEDLENLITDETKLLVTNFPNNPTSWMPTEREFFKIVELCRRHNVVWFSDEMYRFLWTKYSLPSACEVYKVPSLRTKIFFFKFKLKFSMILCNQ